MARPIKRTAKHIPQGVDVVTRTLIMDHMNQGRWHMMHDPDLVKRLGYYLFDAIIDLRTTRVCKKYNAILLPWDAGFWQFHWPPLHWGCRSLVRMVSMRTAGRRGITVGLPRERPSGGWGLSPQARVNALDMLGAAKYDAQLVATAQRKIRNVAKPLEPQIKKPKVPSATEIVSGFNDTPGLLGDNVKRVRIVGSHSEQHREAIYDGLNRAGFQKFWSVPGRSLDSLTITDKRVGFENFASMSDTIEGGSGLAFSAGVARNFGGEALKVHGRAALNVARSVAPGKGYLIAQTEVSVSDYVSNVSVHEFGHMLHLNDQVGSAHHDIDNLINSRFNASDREHISDYARENRQEYFAESFAAYHSKAHPEWLLKNAPKAHKLVEDVLRLRGLL